MSVPLLLTMQLDGELLPEPVKFDPHTEPLMTPEKARLIRYGLSGWELFHREWTAGDLPVPYVSCLADDLVLAYRWWVSRSGEREMTRNKFVEAMAARVPKARRWWRWAGMADPRQGQVFKVGLEGAGVAEMDYLGRGINEFRSALRRLVGDAAVDELG
jgi:putative DNA primase/helicase